MNPVLLVDGDIVAYRCAAAAEKTKYLVLDRDGPEFYDTAKEAKAMAGDEPVWSRKELEPVEHAIGGANALLGSLSNKFPLAPIKVFISGERNFRDGIWKTKKYKGNRIAEKPKHLEAVRKHLVSQWSAVVSQNQEADDDIGIASGQSTVVVSTDKDLDQIPGWHYNWVQDRLYYVTEEDAEKFLWQQVISGDPTDNIPGLPDYGPAKGKKFVDSYFNHEVSLVISLEEAVCDLYKSLGFGYEYFHEQRTLIEILRTPR